MYNLRHIEIVPTFTIVKNHILPFVATAVQIYPNDQNWLKCSQIPNIFEPS